MCFYHIRNSVTSWTLTWLLREMILKALLIICLLQDVLCTYQPGQPGAPWSEEEIDIVRDKASEKITDPVVLFDYEKNVPARTFA